MRIAVSLAAVLCSVSCGDASRDPVPSGDAGRIEVCPRSLPKDCPAPPSYKQDIAPLVETRCLMCHGPGGKAYPARDLTSYDHMYAQRTEILSQVYNCRMPPEDGTPLSARELDLLLLWLVCGAPND